MFARTYFSGRYFAPRYFPGIGANPPVSVAASYLNRRARLRSFDFERLKLIVDAVFPAPVTQPAVPIPAPPAPPPPPATAVDNAEIERARAMLEAALQPGPPALDSLMAMRIIISEIEREDDAEYALLLRALGYDVVH